MKHSFFAGLVMVGLAPAANLYAQGAYTQGWYCEAFCNYEMVVAQSCRSKEQILETEGSTPVQAMMQLRADCAAKSDTVSCSDTPSSVTMVSGDGFNTNNPATIESSCRTY